MTTSIHDRHDESTPPVVVLQSGFGGQRIVDMLVGDQLPRIC